MLPNRRLDRLIAGTSCSERSQIPLSQLETRWAIGFSIRIGPEKLKSAVRSTLAKGLNVSYICRGQSVFSDRDGTLFTGSVGNLIVLPNEGKAKTLHESPEFAAIGYSIPIPYWNAAKLMTPGIAKSCRWKVGFPSREIERFLDIRDSTRAQNGLAAHQTLVELVMLTIRFFEVATQKNKYPNSLDKVHQKISDSNELGVPVTQLAEQHGLNYHSFRKAFKSQYSEAPSAYRNRIRFEKARELLEFTEKSITEIGKLLGYARVDSFSKQFKTRVGHSPRQYRAIHHQSGPRSGHPEREREREREREPLIMRSAGHKRDQLCLAYIWIQRYDFLITYPEAIFQMAGSR